MSLSTSVVLFASAVLFGLSVAQVPGKGKCPDIPVVTGFNKERYLGRWYEYERFEALFEFNGICGQANYTAKPDGHIGVLNMGINKRTKKATSAVGDAFAPDPKVPAKLVVSFPDVPGPFAKGNYWVLSTDYDTYAVVWSCTQLNLKLFEVHGSIAWILTRKRGVLSDFWHDEIYTMFKQYGVDPSHFNRVQQSGCPN